MDFRKVIVVVLVTAAASLALGVRVEAAPLNGSGLLDVLKERPLIQEARVFCYNRRTGRFIHWGRCGSRYRPRSSRPRVYCGNRYTGRFLYWGRCRR